MIRRKLLTFRAARLLRQGKLVAHDTSTVAGIAASPLDSRAIQKFQRFKQRQGPFICIADSMRTAVRHTRYLPHALRRAMQQYWPGNTTLVVPGRPGLPRACYARGKIALRVDDDATSRRLARLSNGLILSTSLNRRKQQLQPLNPRIRMRWHRYVSGVMTAEKRPNAPSSILLWKHGHFHRLR